MCPRQRYHYHLARRAPDPRERERTRARVRAFAHVRMCVWYVGVYHARAYLCALCVRVC